MYWNDVQGCAKVFLQNPCPNKLIVEWTVNFSWVNIWMNWKWWYIVYMNMDVVPDLWHFMLHWKSVLNINLMHTFSYTIRKCTTDILAQKLHGRRRTSKKSMGFWRKFVVTCSFSSTSPFFTLSLVPKVSQIIFNETQEMFHHRKSHW